MASNPFQPTVLAQGAAGYLLEPRLVIVVLSNKPLMEMLMGKSGRYEAMEELGRGGRGADLR